MGDDKNDVPIPKKKCFFITPIGEVDSDERKLSDSYLKILQAPIKNKGYEIIRADQYNKTGKIDTQVFNLLINSELAIVNITGGNANVFYELALRHAVQKPFIPIALPGKSNPFDIVTLRTIYFDPELNPSIIESISKIDQMIDNIENGNSDCFLDNPISMIDLLNKIGQDGPVKLEVVFEQISKILSSVESRDSVIASLKSQYEKNKEFLTWKNNKFILDTLYWIKEQLLRPTKISQEIINLYNTTRTNFLTERQNQNTFARGLGVQLKLGEYVMPLKGFFESMGIVNYQVKSIDLEKEISNLISEIDEIIQIIPVHLD